MIKIFLSLILSILILPISNAFAKTADFKIDGPNGKLVGILQTPNSLTSFPLVIFSHGFTGNKNGTIEVEIAKRLEKIGIASIRFDYDGHGESGGDFQSMTVPKEIEDLKAIYSYATTLDGVTSISLAGHSQGGVVTSMVAGDLGKKKIKSVVLMSPAAALREDAIRGTVMGVNYDSLNPPEYVELPFGDYRLGREYILTAQRLPIYETAEGYRGDVCIVHGLADVVAPYTTALHYDHLYKKSELHLIEGADHVFSNHLDAAAEIVVDFLKRHSK